MGNDLMSEGRSMMPDNMAAGKNENAFGHTRNAPFNGGRPVLVLSNAFKWLAITGEESARAFGAVFIRDAPKGERGSYALKSGSSVTQGMHQEAQKLSKIGLFC